MEVGGLVVDHEDEVLFRVGILEDFPCGEPFRVARGLAACDDEMRVGADGFVIEHGHARVREHALHVLRLQDAAVCAVVIAEDVVNAHGEGALFEKLAQKVELAGRGVFVHDVAAEQEQLRAVLSRAVDHADQLFSVDGAAEMRVRDQCCAHISDGFGRGQHLVRTPYGGHIPHAIRAHQRAQQERKAAAAQRAQRFMRLSCAAEGLQEQRERVPREQDGVQVHENHPLRGERFPQERHAGEGQADGHDVARMAQLRVQRAHRCERAQMPKEIDRAEDGDGRVQRGNQRLHSASSRVSRRSSASQLS